VTYVRAGAVGGDGTIARPFGTIADALRSATPGRTVALAAGRYDEAIEPTAGVRIVGACARDTVLSSATPSASRAVVTVLAHDVGLAHLRIETSARPGIAVAEGSLRLDRVIVRDVELAGVLALPGGVVEGEGVLIDATRPRAGTGGHALYAEDGGHIELSRVALLTSSDAAVFATGAGSAVRLADATITGTRPAPASQGGHGVQAQLGASVELERTAVTENEDAGVFAIAGGTVRLTDVVVSHTRTREADGKGGQGLYVQDDASATAMRVLLSDNHEVAVVARAATLALEDVVVRDTRAGADITSSGFGLFAEDGADVVWTRGRIERATSVGAAIVGSRAMLADVVIADPQPDHFDAALGHGLEVGRGADVTCTRCAIERAHGGAAIATGIGAALTLEDTRVTGTAPRASDGRFGRAIVAQEGASVTARRVLAEGNRDVALFADGPGTTLTVEDAAVVRTRSEEATGIGGRGISVQREAALTVRGLHVEQSQGFGVLIYGASADMRDLVLTGVRPPDCVATTCADAAVAVGLGVHGGATASLRRFSIEDPGVCGVHVVEGGSLDLADGTVRGADVGACVQVEGYDLARLTGTVRYEDNGINVETTAHAAAEPALTLDAAL
jgi:hypothetical protein